MPSRKNQKHRIKARRLEALCRLEKAILRESPGKEHDRMDAEMKVLDARTAR